MIKKYRKDILSFLEGRNYKIQDFLGSRMVEAGGKSGYFFSTWAPKAKSVSLTGDFNDWDNKKNPMNFEKTQGIWWTFVENIFEYENYKYYILGADGIGRMKSDPLGLHYETSPANASKTIKNINYSWNDEAWLKKRNAANHYKLPMNIYEIHLGSWLRQHDDSYLSYEDIAKELPDYLVNMGYTHVEFLPIMEYPLNDSWGYQVTGYFAPTSRYGTPAMLKSLIDQLHHAGIGVILDWVPAHFPKDEFGLYRYDGSPCFEPEDELMSEHKLWGTSSFDISKPQVKNFLISSALFWIEEYHFDGIRIDAVAAMLYRDYNRTEWSKNKYGGNENLEAIDFLRELNSAILTKHPGAIIFAEESTAWPMVTMPPDIGGLGFNYKWNMGWMNDILDYVSLDPIYRGSNHNKLTFSMHYAFSENYILPISHDEVVHGKKSLIDKMPGSYEQKFSGVKTFFGFMMSHPGKKLIFMGAEFGQFIEWDFNKELDWFLIDYKSHKSLKKYINDLNHFYLNSSPLWEIENSWDGFKWVVPNDTSQNVLIFRRIDDEGEEIITVCNFSFEERTNYRFGVSEVGTYKEIFTSESEIYGGGGSKNKNIIRSANIPAHDFDQSISINIPSMSVSWYKINKK